MSSECTLKDLREDHMIHQTECSLEGWGLTNMEPPTEQEAHAEFDRVIAAELAAAERRGAAKALRNFADAHRFPSAWVMFRRVDDSPVSVGDLLRETADRIEAPDA